MALSSIELCSSALVKLGANGISSFEDGTAEARVASSLYPLIRDAMLCAHPWSFATAKVKLARLSAEPVTDYLHAYQLPLDFLKALSAGDEARGRGLVYQIVNRQLHTNADQVVLAYIFRPSEGDFPPTSRRRWSPGSRPSSASPSPRTRAGPSGCPGWPKRSSSSPS